MILSICDNSTVQEVLSIISLVVKIICIATPIILIVSLMINITRKISDGKGDILNDMGSTIIPKVIAAVLIFFIPTFVDIIGKITLSDVDYRQCIKFETLKEISPSKKEEINVLIERVESSMSETDYTIAINEVNKLSESETKNKFLERLKKTRELLDLQASVDNAVKFGGEKEYNLLLPKVNALEESSFKRNLLERLEIVRQRVEEDKERNVPAPGV